MRSYAVLLILFAVALAVAGCDRASGPEASSPEASVPQAAAAPVPAAAPVAAPASTPPPAVTPAADPAVTLPEEFAKNFHTHPEMTVTAAETTDAAKMQYKVTGELRSSARDVMDYYVKYFQEHGWAEDAVMEQEGASVVSFKKDGYLQYVDTREGGIGVKITITTGRE